MGIDGNIGRNWGTLDAKGLVDEFGTNVALKMMDIGDEVLPLADVKTLNDVTVGISKDKIDLYDKKIPQFAKKLLSRYGVKIVKRRIDPKRFDVSERDGVWTVIDEDNHPVKRFHNEKQVNHFMESAGNIEVWSFDITPEMREDFLQNGIPLTMQEDEEDERMVA